MVRARRGDLPFFLVLFILFQRLITTTCFAASSYITSFLGPSSSGMLLLKQQKQTYQNKSEAKSLPLSLPPPPTYLRGKTNSVLGGLASQWMHDEDNRNGLLVTNKRGDIWTAYGDDNYFASMLSLLPSSLLLFLPFAPLPSSPLIF